MQENEQKIKEIDGKLDALREKWTNSVGKQKRGILSMIDKLLDERLQHMPKTN